MRRSTKIKSKIRNIETKDYSPIDRFNYLLLNNNIDDASLLLDDNLTVNTLNNNNILIKIRRKNNHLWCSQNAQIPKAIFCLPSPSNKLPQIFHISNHLV